MTNLERLQVEISVKGDKAKKAFADVRKEAEITGKRAQEALGNVAPPPKEEQKVKGLTASLKKLRAEMREASQKRRIDAGLEKPTEAYVDLLRKIEMVTARINEFQAALKEANSAGTGPENWTKGYASLQEKMEDAAAKIDAIRNQIAQTPKYGFDSVLKKLRTDLSVAEEKFDRLQAKAEMMENNGTAYQSTEKASQLNGAIGVMRGDLSALLEHKKALEENGGAFESIAKASKKAKGGIQLFGKSLNFKTVLKYAFGIRSLYFLFRKIRQAFKEGYTNLAKFDKSIGKDLSGIKGRFTEFKNSLGVAIAPIVTALKPVIDWLMQALTDAMNLVGRFFAALSGKSSYAQSVYKIDDSLKSASNSSEALQRSLMGFDKINKLTDNSSSNYNGKFETTEIEDNIKNLVAKLKGYATSLKKFFDPIFEWFKQAWSDIKDAVVNAWNKIKAKIDEHAPQIEAMIRMIGDVLMWTWKNVIQPVLELIKDGVVWVIGFIATLLSDVIDIMGGVIDFIDGLVSGDWARVWGGLGNVVKGLGRVIYDILFLGLGDFDTFVSGVQENVENIKSAIGGMFDDLKKKINDNGGGIKGILITVADGAIGIIESAINKAIDVVNKAIRLINSTGIVSIGELSHVQIGRLADAFDNKTKGGGLAPDMTPDAGPSTYIPPMPRPVGANGLKLPSMPFANGGFPETGQLFVAREAGPEMVGTIGNRAAVANNDQIVSAISAGVYAAVSDAMGNQSINVSLVGDANKLFKAVQTQAQNYAMATGLSPFPV